MITTVVGNIASIKEGKMIKGADNQPLPVIEFNIALDRGNYKKRVSMLNGKEYDSDFYKVTIFGQSAVSFHQYASVGREIQISGRFVQEEFLSKDQLVQIVPTNPLFPYFAQLVGKVADVVGAPDGNVYIKGNHSVSKTVLICQEYRWTGKNPNAQPTFNNFQAPTNANAFTNTGFATAPKFGAPATTAPAGFGAPAPVQGFGVAPVSAPQGFGVQAPQGFAQPVAPVAQAGFGASFVAPTAPVAPTSFAGFGGESVAPSNFAQAPAVVGFAPAPVEETGTEFAPTAPAPVAPVVAGVVATNLPTPESLVASADNQGF